MQNVEDELNYRKQDYALKLDSIAPLLSKAGIHWYSPPHPLVLLCIYRTNQSHNFLSLTIIVNMKTNKKYEARSNLL